MQPDTLVVVLGDSPRLPTGLGRIAGDLAAHLWSARERLGIHLLQVGWEYGAPTLWPVSWPLVVFPTIGEDWGAAQVFKIIEAERVRLRLSSDQVVLLTVWDPARCFEYREWACHKWGYFAVDGHNIHKSFGGPAADAVRKYHRVLGYGRYGAEVLSNVVGTTVQYLPHGHYWGNEVREHGTIIAEPPQNGWMLGCVASNTPRKDLGLFFQVLHELRAGGERVYGWLHTDELVTGAWSIPELIDVYGIEPQWITISGPPADDAYLQRMYASCAVTLTPGRGEGFCYPIVESLAMGRAVVHADYAGGAELTPPAGRVVPEYFDEINPYCVQRPHLNVGEVAGRCQELARRALNDETLPHFYAGTVANLQWGQLWPRWETWVRQGLNEIRERR